MTRGVYLHTYGGIQLLLAIYNVKGEMKNTFSPHWTDKPLDPKTPNFGICDSIYVCIMNSLYKYQFVLMCMEKSPAPK